MDPEKMSGSQLGLVEAREEGRWESLFPAEGGTLTKVQRWEVNRVQPENYEYLVLEYKHSSDI